MTHTAFRTRRIQTEEEVGSKGMSTIGRENVGTLLFIPKRCHNAP